MENNFWHIWYSGWGWMLWFAMLFLMFSSFGNWGYTYQAHQKITGNNPLKNALDLLNERFVLGEIKEDEYLRIKGHILPSK